MSVPKTDTPKTRITVGIDLGGTKIEGLAIADDGAELARVRVATPRDDYSATLDAIATLVFQLERTVGTPARVGVGIPGIISPATGLVKNSNSTWLIGHPHRIGYLEDVLADAASRNDLWITTTGEIAEFYAEQFPSNAG